MHITTTRFGTIEIEEARLVEIPAGLLGFEAYPQFGVLDHTPGSPFRWLQSTTEPSLAFVVIDPFEFFLDYDFAISDVDEEQLDLRSPEDVEVLALVTISPQDITANLVGPLVINRRNRQARQLVLSEPRYGTRHSLLSKPSPIEQHEALSKPEPVCQVA